MTKFKTNLILHKQNYSQWVFIATLRNINTQNLAENMAGNIRQEYGRELIGVTTHKLIWELVLIPCQAGGNSTMRIVFLHG